MTGMAYLGSSIWRTKLVAGSTHNNIVMPMSIEGLDNIKTVFSVLHDGEICHSIEDGSKLELEVHIQYLAERVNREFRKFSVVLEDVENLGFTTWPDDAKADPDVLTDATLMFTNELEILSGEIENNEIKVACNQPLPGLGYCGGFLYFRAKSATVKDVSGKTYSIEELCSLSDSYWDDWANRNKA